MADTPIAFIDLAAQQARLKDDIDRRIAAVLAHGRYILGPEVAEFETALADFCGARHAVACSNGTDALSMALRAWGIGPGDAVFVPSFTFIATAEAVSLVGATPVFVDVERDSFNLDTASLSSAIDSTTDLRPRAVIPVDLFGLPAGHKAIATIAARHDLLILDDAAQGFGGRLDGRAVGTFGHATSTSFFPAKPLGCYGDGGAVLTDDADLADRLRSIRVHGKGNNKYDNVRIGLNARLDTMQAAILLSKLSIFADELEARQRVAARYTDALAHSAVTPPMVPPGAWSAWAQYTILTDRRDDLVAACQARGVPTQIYYPIPMHRQTGYRHYPQAPQGCPNADWLAERAISLPMHPYLSEADQDRVIDAIRAVGASNAL
ncbi:DegT/DnrJ/EryC1/StrS family aminotransferase [Fodinicurvata sp. EGI_FJ10296]|uniref:DegT/DnrJ/EryC1/StrS family aminotransferase n=1 Tax=Fodinicurvata sp. EGI_FJ10296 TaxID=3231908 RepID=UPI003454B6F9